MLLNSKWVIEDTKGEIKKYLETNEKQKQNIPKSLECRKSGSKREVHTNIGLPQDTRKIPNKQPNFTTKGIRKIRTNKALFSRRKEIIKIRAEINEMEMKKQ